MCRGEFRSGRGEIPERGVASWLGHGSQGGEEGATADRAGARVGTGRLTCYYKDYLSSKAEPGREWMGCVGGWSVC